MHSNRVFDTSPELLLGEGSLRSCYRIPGEPYCVKFYRDPSTHKPWTKASTRRHIFYARFVWWANANYHEWRYHRRLRRELPPELFAAFPESVELVYSTSRGWGIVESLVTNADGTAPKRILEELTSKGTAPDQRRELLKATAALLDRLADHAVRFFDPPNLMVQWTGPKTFRLRITDFEPTCKTAVPGLSLIRPYVRSKARRRNQRFFEQTETLLQTLGVASSPAR